MTAALDTYANAEVIVVQMRHQRAVAITNPEGRVVLFYEAWTDPADRSVPHAIVSILIAESLAVAESDHQGCAND